MKKAVFFMVLLVLFFPAIILAADQPKASVSGYILFHFEDYINGPGMYSIVPDNAKTPTDYYRKSFSGYNDFKLTRTYVHFKVQPTDKMKIQLTLDSYQDQNFDSSKNKTGGYYYIYVKYGFLQYDWRPEVKARVGLVQYPWAEYIYNNVWPYLMMERGYFTYWGIFSTADFGGSVFGSLLDDHLQYTAAIFNGGGYKAVETDKNKEYLGMLLFQAGQKNKVNGSIASIYSHQTMGTHNNAGENWDKEGKNDTVAVGGVINAYWLKLGGEYLYGAKTLRADTVNFLPEVDPKRYPEGYFSALKFGTRADRLLDIGEQKDVHYGGYAAYLVASLSDKIDLVGRYDFYDPNFSSKYDNDSVQMWMSGLVYKFPGGVQASVDYRQYDFEGQDPDDDDVNEATPMQVIYTHWKIPF